MQKFVAFLTRVSIHISLMLMACFATDASTTNDCYVEKIRTCKLFANEILPSGTNAPDPKDSEDLWQAIDSSRGRPRADRIQAVDEFVRIHTNSAWASSLKANLAVQFREEGRYSRALAYWRSAWEAVKGY